MKLGISHDEPPTIYALLNSYVNFSQQVPTKISDLASTGRAMFFDFDYPLATGISKAEFETMILNHFLMRRIGYETVTAFKIALNVKLNEIMPLYNKLFESIENWNIFTDGERVTRTTTGNGTDATLNSTSTTTSTTESGTNGNTTTSDRRSSDTPQNSIADVQNGNYVSEYNYDTDVSNTTTSNTGSSTGSTSGSSNTTTTNSENETITRSPKDKMALYSEFLKNRQNIYTMIFKDLDSLFYQLI